MTRKLALALAPILSLTCSMPVLADVTSVSQGQQARINAHNTCRMVRNNGASPVMVPHRTAQEWVSGGNSFLQRVPPSVSVQNCEVKATFRGTICNIHNGGQITQRNCSTPDVVQASGGVWPSDLDVLMGFNANMQVSVVTFSARNASLPATTMNASQCGAALGRPVSTVSAANATVPNASGSWRRHTCGFASPMPVTDATPHSDNNFAGFATAICNSLTGVSTIYMVVDMAQGAQVIMSRGDVWDC